MEKDKNPVKVELGSGSLNSSGDSSQFGGGVTRAVWYADGTISDEDLDLINGHLDDLTLDECHAIIQEAVEEHADDPGLDSIYYQHLQSLVTPEKPADMTSEEYEHHLRFEAFVISQWSIYSEVRAATRPIAENDETAETFRVYVLSFIWAGAGACLDTFFTNRYPSIKMNGLALQILIVACGKLWSALPQPKSRRWRWLNPGPWTFKEQMLTSCAVSVAANSPYVYYVMTTQQNDQFFGFPGGGYGYVILMLLMTTFMGFGLAGLLRVILVYRQEAVWYQVLPNIALNRALVRREVRESINGWPFTRQEMFWIAAWASFGWYWITDFVFKALSYFDWPAWIRPNNIDLAAICGAESGLSLNPIPFLTTLDWNVADQQGMIMPWWGQANALFGIVVSFIAVIIVWYTNVRYTGYLPINSNSLYDNTGKTYNVNRVLDLKTGLFDYERYRLYSLPWFTAGALVGYGCNFMLYTTAVMYAILYHGHRIVVSVKLMATGLFNSQKMLESQNDRFSRAQLRYREVPEWWFLFVFVAAFAVSIGLVEGYKFTNTPVWSIVLGIGIALVLIVPFALLYQATGYQIDPNEIIEMIQGLLRPGDAQSNMIVKAIGTTLTNQAEDYISTQKQAHYVGIPPRPLFRLQMMSCLVAVFVQSGIITWQLEGGIPGMCTLDNAERFTCQGSRSYFNAGVAWGTIGTSRIMKHVYPSLKWVFLIGAVLPIPVYLARRFLMRGRLQHRFAWLRTINELAMLSGAKQWAPSSLQYTLPNVFLCWFFSYFVRRRFPRWHGRYVHVIWAGLGIGVAYSALIMFFSTEYHHIANIKWWGNEVYQRGLDASYEARRLKIPDIGYFGPSGPMP